jgi:hypothetical protein
MAAAAARVVPDFEAAGLGSGSDIDLAMNKMGCF